MLIRPETEHQKNTVFTIKYSKGGGTAWAHGQSNSISKLKNNCNTALV